MSKTLQVEEISEDGSLYGLWQEGKGWIENPAIDQPLLFTSKSAARWYAKEQLHENCYIIDAAVSKWILADETAKLDAANATIAELRAEVAALKARPAMAWRRLDVSTDDLPPGRYLVSVECFGETIVSEAEYVANQADCPGDEEILVGMATYRLHQVTHYIPWSDLMPPGGEDAS